MQSIERIKIYLAIGVASAILCATLTSANGASASASVGGFGSAASAATATTTGLGGGHFGGRHHVRSSGFRSHSGHGFGSGHGMYENGHYGYGGHNAGIGAHMGGHVGAGYEHSSHGGHHASHYGGGHYGGDVHHKSDKNKKLIKMGAAIGVVGGVGLAGKMMHDKHKHKSSHHETHGGVGVHGGFDAHVDGSKKSSFLSKIGKKHHSY